MKRTVLDTKTGLAEEVDVLEAGILLHHHKHLEEQKDKHYPGHDLELLVVLGVDGGFDISLGEFVNLFLQQFLCIICVIDTNIHTITRSRYLLTHLLIKFGNNDVAFLVTTEVT